MRTLCSREIFTKKCRQQQIFDSDLKGAWHYNHVTFTPIAKNFMLYCRLIYMLSILCVRLTIKVKVGTPESFKVGWYPPKKTGSSHLNRQSDRFAISDYSTIFTSQRVDNVSARFFSHFLRERSFKSRQNPRVDFFSSKKRLRRIQNGVFPYTVVEFCGRWIVYNSRLFA